MLFHSFLFPFVAKIALEQIWSVVDVNVQRNVFFKFAANFVKQEEHEVRQLVSSALNILNLTPLKQKLKTIAFSQAEIMLILRY